MDSKVTDEVLSSSARVKIEGAVSVRPRTLGELADLTGMSVQGVLRHLRRLEKVGLIEGRKVSAKAPKARRLYAAKGYAFGDYSVSGLTVVKSTPRASEGGPRAVGTDLERKSGELIIQRRRIRDAAKRLGRMIDELDEVQQSLSSALAGMSLDDSERLILEVLLTEETLADGARALARHYGITDRRSIDEALAKAKRNDGK